MLKSFPAQQIICLKSGAVPVVQVCDGRDYLENGCSGATSEATFRQGLSPGVKRGRAVGGGAA